ncbi:endonuclease domain-containing protein [bacterium]|nr:endonuclease domain-containing protein [bacterium]
MPNRKTQLARTLRQSSTDAERLLWYHIRNRHLDGLKFRRQYPVVGYVADFACLDAKLLVELDGSQHGAPPAMRADQRRTEALSNSGFVVLRFWNNEVLTDTNRVLAEILRVARY